MDCVKCKAAIEDDSFYCDQCGGEIFRCTAADCRKPGGPKRCMHCGKPMAPAHTLGDAPAATANTGAAPVLPAPAASPAAPVPNPPAAAGNTGRSAVAIGKLRLHSAARGIDIEPADGDVLGRVNGPHSGTLGRFSNISSSHLQVRRAPDGSWRVTDLKSFNGTFYNGNPLTVHQEFQVLDGGTLRLGDIDVQVSIR